MLPLQSPLMRQRLPPKPSGGQRRSSPQASSPPICAVENVSSGLPGAQPENAPYLVLFMFPPAHRAGFEGGGRSSVLICSVWALAAPQRSDPWHPNCSRVREALLVLLLPLVLTRAQPQAVFEGLSLHSSSVRFPPGFGGTGSLSLPQDRSRFHYSEMDPIPDARGEIQKTGKLFSTQMLFWSP